MSSDVSPTAETPLAINVVASTVTKVSSTGTGTRNFDGAPPTIIATAAIPYPAAATGTPLAWSHDGSHFNLRDSGTLYGFTAFDCGGGNGAPFELAGFRRDDHRFPYTNCEIG